ncbi:MAG TPA: tRNA preQ1(34) S-adenosylmethionine ribosyltransferase-isomerase QueA [Clostridiaceae bacterium]|nr:tRNA preQ1(34) S-adenosylmethionine ribosyltransferase-isomerase QueA [Clostridiaceae bacterium]
MKKSDFYYELPEKYIAQHPAKRRDQSKLMVLLPDRTIQDRIFSDLPNYLLPGDCLVLNNTKVLPARLYGTRKDSGAQVEFLLIKQIDDTDWEVIVKPGKKCRPGQSIVFLPRQLEADILAIREDGNRIVRFRYDGIWQELLAEAGEMPLPPYITAVQDDLSRYQTVYAKHDGSAAAPTAGLHFTPELLQKIKSIGVEIAELTLHVGIGTFRPVKEDDITKHLMHNEYYILDEETARLINQTKDKNGRIIAVGTTSCRVLETLTDPLTNRICSGEGETDIFIYPGYRFKLIDGLITNFHLPESTLLMLVAALYGRENILQAYQHAKENDYRFFSFGDAMLILPEESK